MGHEQPTAAALTVDKPVALIHDARRTNSGAKADHLHQSTLIRPVGDMIRPEFPNYFVKHLFQKNHSQTLEVGRNLIIYYSLFYLLPNPTSREALWL